MATLNWWLGPAMLAERGVCAGWLSLPGPRPAQRAVVRQRLPDGLAGAFGQAEGSLALIETGAVPRLSGLAGAEWLSLSYAGERVAFALAARPVGIDLVEVGALPDWREVAQDFLGPQVTRTLEARPLHEQDASFALAWAELEACSKACGLGLAEWSEGRAARLGETALVQSALDRYFAWTVALAA